MTFVTSQKKVGSFRIATSAAPPVRQADRRGSVIVGSAYRLDSGVLAAERLARNVRVPVHERSVGILFPRSNMQRVECRDPEAIGAPGSLE